MTRYWTVFKHTWGVVWCSGAPSLYASQLISLYPVLIEIYTGYSHSLLPMPSHWQISAVYSSMITSAVSTAGSAGQHLSIVRLMRSVRCGVLSLFPRIIQLSATQAGDAQQCHVTIVFHTSIQPRDLKLILYRVQMQSSGCHSASLCFLP